MIADSLRTRGVHFAFLFGPPRFLARQEASEIHGAACDALGMDDLSLRYNTSEPTSTPSSRGFSIVLERKEGRGRLGITLDNKRIQEPLRLLLEREWPPETLRNVEKEFDLVAEAVFRKLGSQYQRVLAETRLRAQCTVREGSAITFFRERVLRLSPAWFGELGEPLVFDAVKFEVQPSWPKEDPLEGAGRQLDIQVLREDPQCLYLELVSQWPQIAPPVGLEGVIDLGSHRSIESSPSRYVREAYDFLVKCVSTLATEGKAEQ